MSFPYRGARWFVGWVTAIGLLFLMASGGPCGR